MSLVFSLRYSSHNYTFLSQGSIMITHHILSVSCLLALLACTKLPAVAFVYGRSHAFQQGVALNHLLATTSPSSQSEKDRYGTYAEIPTLYEDASSMIKGDVFSYWRFGNTNHSSLSIISKERKNQFT
jgi:hypothetical protein